MWREYTSSWSARLEAIPEACIPMLQFVSPVHPVVPILNSLLGLLIHLDALQLHQRNGKLTPSPPDQHKHIMLALLV